MPNRAPGPQMRRSQAIAMTQPPPTATPWTWAIVAVFTLSKRPITRSSRDSYASASSGVRKSLNWLMSVPATKARSPAPRRTRTLTAGSASAASQASRRASYIAHVIALRAAGRLKVRVATGPSTS